MKAMHINKSVPFSAYSAYSHNSEIKYVYKLIKIAIRLR